MRNLLAKSLLGVLLPLTWAATAPRLWAQDIVPDQMNFSGYLTDSGTGLPDTGTYYMRFTLFNGGTPLWCADYSSVSVASGDFSVILGSSSQGGAVVDGACNPISSLALQSSAVSTIVWSGATQLTLDVEISTDGTAGGLEDLSSSTLAVSSSVFALQADTARAAASATTTSQIQGVAVSATAPTSGQVLSYDSGTAEWEPSTSAAGTPSNPANSIQFNSAGSFGGSANLVWNGTSLGVGGPASLQAQVDVSGLNANGTLRVYDQSASGNTREIIRGGAAQSANLTEWQTTGAGVLASMSDAGFLTLFATPSGSTDGILSIGSGGFSGGAGNFTGSASGTALAINAASSYAGNLADFQVDGSSEFKVDASGNIWIGGTEVCTSSGCTASGGGSVSASDITGQVAPANGGTGLNTSISTGVPIVTAGTWSVPAELPVGDGGTGLASGNSGGIPYFSSSSTMASSSALSVGSLVVGGGAGASPADVADVAAGSVLVSGGVGSNPVYSANPGVTSLTATGSATTSALSLSTATTSNDVSTLGIGGTAITGNTGGALIGANTSSAYGGDLMNLQNDSASAFRVDSSGNVWIGGTEICTSGGCTASGGGSVSASDITGQVAAANGGTGLNTSISTGVPIVTVGTWSVPAELPVGDGGTGLASGNSGGIPYFSSSSTMASSSALSVGSLVVGGGAGASPADVADVAAGSVLVSGGVGSNPVYSANPGVTSLTATGSATTSALSLSTATTSNDVSTLGIGGTAITGNTGGALIGANTSSAYGGDLMNLQNDSASAFRVDSSGNVWIGGTEICTSGGCTSSGSFSASGLSGLTPYGILAGSGTGSASYLGPDATSGQPLLSAGSSSEPAFGQLNLASSNAVTGKLGNTNGGTGQDSSGWSGIPAVSSGTWSSVADVATGSVLISQGTAANPAWSATPSLTSLTATGTAAGTALSLGASETTGDGIFMNPAGGYSGSFVDFQVAGGDEFKVDASGNVWIGGTEVCTSSGCTASGSVSAGNITGKVTPANGGTGQDTSASTGVPSISGGTWSVNPQLSASLGGTGLNTSISTGVPIVTAGTWSVPAPQLPVGDGGTGLASGTAGGVPYFSASNTIASSGALAAGSIVVGGAAAGPSDVADVVAGSVLVSGGVGSNPVYSANPGVTSLTATGSATTSALGLSTAATSNDVSTLGIGGTAITGNTGGALIGANTSSAYGGDLMNLQNDSASAFRVDSSGNVWIGGTKVCTSSGCGTSSVSGTANTMAKFATATTVGNSGVTDDGTTVGTSELMSLTPSSASTGLTVTQSGAGYAATFMGGNVGIGTTSPTAALTVSGAMVSLQSDGTVTGSSPNWGSSNAFSASNAFEVNPSSAVANDTLTLTFTGTPANGASYMIEVEDAVVLNVVFSAASCANFKFKPLSTGTNTISTLGAGRTLITLTTIYNGTNYNCTVTWASGYQ